MKKHRFGHCFVVINLRNFYRHGQNYHVESEKRKTTKRKNQRKKKPSQNKKRQRSTERQRKKERGRRRIKKKGFRTLPSSLHLFFFFVLFFRSFFRSFRFFSLSSVLLGRKEKTTNEKPLVCVLP